MKKFIILILAFLILIVLIGYMQRYVFVANWSQIIAIILVVLTIKFMGKIESR